MIEDDFNFTEYLKDKQFDKKAKSSEKLNSLENLSMIGEKNATNILLLLSFAIPILLLLIIVFIWKDLFEGIGLKILSTIVLLLSTIFYIIGIFEIFTNLKNMRFSNRHSRIIANLDLDIEKSEKQKIYNIAKLAELETQADLDNIKNIIDVKRRLKEIEVREKEIGNKLKSLPLEELEFKKQYEMELLKVEKEKVKLRNEILGL